MSYVVPEDREMVAREMEIKHVLSVLDKEGEHVLTYGVKDGKIYLRKRFQYVYYDRPGRIVFLCETTLRRNTRNSADRKSG